jgi:SAM-dependent methyltransferase
MKYPDYKTYEKLYQRYINKQNLYDMMDLAGSYKDKNFLDICCGNGAATTEAIKRKAKSCCVIDQEYKMIPKIFTKSNDVYILPVKEALGEINRKKYNIAFCRQGINYWLDKISIQLLHNIMDKNGIFIFNTFNTCPTKEPMIKEYEIDAVKFVEISYLEGDDIVHHVQVREGYPPHITRFRWFSKEYIKNCLDKYFNYGIITKNKTDIYKCVRK